MLSSKSSLVKYEKYLNELFSITEILLFFRYKKYNVLSPLKLFSFINSISLKDKSTVSIDWSWQLRNTLSLIDLMLLFVNKNAVCHLLQSMNLISFNRFF